MIFTETPLAGAFVIDIEPIADDRGFNARSWCVREFEAHGLPTGLVQHNIIRNRRRGTLRGLHYQASPFAQSKLFRCTRGAIYDVIVDLRPDSPTYLGWFGVELSADSYRMIFVPEQFGQGFLTLTDDAELVYQVSEFHTPAAERGARYDDPAFGIKWPAPIVVLSEKDRRWPPFAPGAPRRDVAGRSAGRP
jgi:dTDP-4-dehydrorhamnose 3,5-epimerase